MTLILEHHPKTSSYIIIQDGKLYVIGGLKYSLPTNYCFMEFLTLILEHHPIKSPHIIILDGKLYVIGELKYILTANYCFMEFFDPNIGTWEPLSNTPFHRQLSEMVTTLFENKKKKEKGKKKKKVFFIPYSTIFCTYNVNDCTRPNLNPAVPKKLFKGYFCHLIWLNLLILVTCCIGFPLNTMIISWF